jgi:hypothetical protein
VLRGTVGEDDVIESALCAVGGGVGVRGATPGGVSHAAGRSSLDEPGGWGPRAGGPPGGALGVAAADARLVELAKSDC